MSRSEILFANAQKHTPGGVNSPVRAFRSVGGTPRFVRRAQGAHFWDENAQQFTDYIGSWGPMILGHGHPEVMAAVVVILIVLVQLVQSIGEWIAARFDKRAPRNRGR